MRKALLVLWLVLLISGYAQADGVPFINLDEPNQSGLVFEENPYLILDSNFIGVNTIKIKSIKFRHGDTYIATKRNPDGTLEHGAWWEDKGHIVINIGGEVKEDYEALQAYYQAAASRDGDIGNKVMEFYSNGFKLNNKYTPGFFFSGGHWTRIDGERVLVPVWEARISIYSLSIPEYEQLLAEFETWADGKLILDKEGIEVVDTPYKQSEYPYKEFVPVE